MSSMQRELSSLEYSVSHSNHTALYTRASRKRLLFANRQRGIIRLPVGCADTQWTSGIISPVLQGPGKDEWHTTTKSDTTAGAGNQARVS